MAPSLERGLHEFKRDLGYLPDPTEPPPTILEVTGRSQHEQEWQRLLFHYLSPNEAHGLDRYLLATFLEELSNRDDIDLDISWVDLAHAQVELEVNTDHGRPDAVLWSGQEWFICFELKLWADEAGGQTEAYANIETFQGIDLVKDDIPTAHQVYLYLAPDQAAQPASEEFVHISWEWVVSVLETFLVESHGEYPARTTAQLNEFIGTIKSELSMTEFQENQQEKAELYLDYYDEISSAQSAFDNLWEEFKETWGTRLAQAMESARIVADSPAPEKFVTVDIETEHRETERWYFLQEGKWAGIRKHGWWRSTDDHAIQFERTESLEGISFYHRLDFNRNLAIDDEILELQFWHSASNSDAFTRRFNRELDERLDGLGTALPESVSVESLTDSKGQLLTVRYDIETEASKTFFESYTAALETAVSELVVQDEVLVDTLDDAYSTAFNEVLEGRDVNPD